MAVRRRNATETVPAPSTLQAKGSNGSKPEQSSTVGVSEVAPALLDFYTALTMLFGGCCSNVISYEQLLNMNPRFGSAMTFCQTLFIATQSLPSFLTFSGSGFLPRLKPRQVPLQLWAIQVLVLTTGSLLNNWAFAYNVPITIFIVFRSAGKCFYPTMDADNKQFCIGLPVSMLFGFLILKKRYSVRQLISIIMVTAGVIVVTLSRATSSTETQTHKLSSDDFSKYFIGISMLTVSLFCGGLLGMLQEQTYTKYGPCWQEGMFYTHALSLPIYIFLGHDIQQGIVSLYNSPSNIPAFQAFGILAGNLLTQLICVSGVNRLSSQVSSVSTNIALTVRKALSLCFSVWWFGTDWNAQLGIGAFMVFFGSFMYTLNSDKIKKE
ncbi:UDP-N-acetylglucosamine transporter YEA4 [Psilocybe cubensis]|uniref:UDP-N-acetylglucosamine transporter YEA4 n=1 Tax=Psilocybe cubensis TaxID=181762 RepID=A0ACB8GZ92_PSICU|nr:UDP-N-acetylglucosamine transporter YEA4 [Psilocybe cubensis]KAH9480551.1 UDP-N-acetylglucosamine transporter YEA4 [Psilocybe cubensis]